MRIKDGFVLRQLAGTWAVLPLGADMVDFNGMLSLNDAGAKLWQALEQECTLESLVNVLTSIYNVSDEQARMDADEFVKKLYRAGCLEE